MNNASHTKSSRSKLAPNLSWTAQANELRKHEQQRQQLLKRLDVASNTTELKALLRELIIIVTE